MATKRRRGKTYHYTIRRKHLLPAPLYFSFDDEAEGDQYAARLEALLDQGIVPEAFRQPERIETIGDAIRAYEAAVAVKDHDVLRVIDERHGKVRLSSCTYAWVENWITAMKRVNRLSPSRIRKFKGSLQRCLNWVQAKHPDILPTNPLTLLPRGYASYAASDGEGRRDIERDRRLEKGEEEAIRRILAGAKPEGRQRPLELHDQPALVLLFDLALETAMRLREMFTLDWYQVDLERKTIFLEKTKNGDKRQVPLSSVALRRLREEGPGDGPVFPWEGTLDQITSRLSRQWARIFDAAGCPDLRFHDLRHEATCRIYERTRLSDLKIALITGHKDLKMLKRYANLRASDLAEELW